MVKNLLIPFFLICFACSDNINPEPQHIHGIWHMTLNRCECQNFKNTFPKGDHIWALDLVHQRLTVSNNVIDTLQVFESGQYHLEMKGDTIWIDQMELLVSLNADTLLLKQRIVDGPWLTLIRD